MEKILIGKVVSCVGIKGELKIYSYSEPGKYKTYKHLYLEKKKEMKEYKLIKSRNVGNTEIVLLEGINDRNTAETMINSEVYIMDSDLQKLPKGTFYVRDIIGCQMVDFESNKAIGEIVDVLQNSAQDNYQVELPTGKTVLIPAVKEFIKEVDIENKLVKVTLIPGFIDDGAINA